MSQLVLELKRRSTYQSSENDYLADPTDLEMLISDAVTLHNSTYSVTPDGSTLPMREKLCVLYLALSGLCLIRAAHFANDTDVQSVSGFASDRSTPFDKNKELSAFYDKKYAELCAALGVVGANSPVCTDATSRDNNTSAASPFSIGSPLPSVSLDAFTVANDGTSTLKFSYPAFADFVCVKIYYMTGSVEIYQPWNIDSKVAPQINDDAKLVLNSSNASIRSIKLRDLMVTSGTIHRLIVVLQNINGQFGFSNEQTFTMPTP